MTQTIPNPTNNGLVSVLLFYSAYNLCVRLYSVFDSVVDPTLSAESTSDNRIVTTLYIYYVLKIYIHFDCVFFLNLFVCVWLILVWVERIDCGKAKTKPKLQKLQDQHQIRIYNYVSIIIRKFRRRR